MREAKYLIIPYLVLAACAIAPVRTPDPTNPGVVLPERVLIEGIKNRQTQGPSDCVPVSLEMLFRFYGVEADRREIADQVQRTRGTYTKRDVPPYVKKRGFNFDSFADTSEDKRRIKYYLSQRVPVCVSIGHIWSSHMMVLAGYDDSKKVFIVADPGWRALREWRYIDFKGPHDFWGSWCYLIYPESMEDQIILYCTRVIESNPGAAESYYERGNAYKERGKYDQAITDYMKAFEIKPGNPKAANSLAWLLATVKEKELRDGKRAVEFALKACELTEWKNPSYLDTLAAAYARDGDFEKAVKWQLKALESNDRAFDAAFYERLKLYKERKPWPPE